MHHGLLHSAGRQRGPGTVLQACPGWWQYLTRLLFGTMFLMRARPIAFSSLRPTYARLNVCAFAAKYCCYVMHSNKCGQFCACSRASPPALDSPGTATATHALSRRCWILPQRGVLPRQSPLLRNLEQVPATGIDSIGMPPSLPPLTLHEKLLP